MSTSVIPKSKAKTAYGLLSEVRRLILAEPLRIAMGTWILKRKDFGGSTSFPFPACGTVGCIGGWTETLKAKPGTRLHAEEILGLNDTQTDALFYDQTLCCENDQQTPRHARHVAQHIAKFQRKHATQLKAKAV